MSAPPHDPAAWIEKATHDLTMARRALDPEEPLPDMACYHAQQCAEKALKAFLVSKHSTFRFVHDLTYLTQKCAEIDVRFNQLLSQADVLSEYAARVRYPVERGMEPSDDQAREAISFAERFLDSVKDYMA